MLNLVVHIWNLPTLSIAEPPSSSKQFAIRSCLTCRYPLAQRIPVNLSDPTSVRLISIPSRCRKPPLSSVIEITLQQRTYGYAGQPELQRSVHLHVRSVTPGAVFCRVLYVLDLTFLVNSKCTYWCNSGSKPAKPPTFESPREALSNHAVCTCAQCVARL